MVETIPSVVNQVVDLGTIEQVRTSVIFKFL